MSSVRFGGVVIPLVCLSRFKATGKPEGEQRRGKVDRSIEMNTVLTAKSHALSANIKSTQPDWILILGGPM